MKRKTGMWLLGLACFGVLALGLGLVKEERVLDCGFTPEEFRVTFRDRNGSPFRDVQLAVETEGGVKTFLFPVTDYVPNRVPASDDKGVLVFHHVPTRGIEFTQVIHRWRFSEWETGWVLDRDVPAYVCRFVFNRKEVYRATYRDLAHQPGRGRVTRLWEWPDWPASEYVQGLSEGQTDWDARRRQLFGFNKDGKLDYGERVAASIADEIMEKTFAGWRDPEKRKEEIAFEVVERVVNLP